MARRQKAVNPNGAEGVPELALVLTSCWLLIARPHRISLQLAVRQNFPRAGKYELDTCA
jgi:hypothetical protein